jgi:hypothetical protein
MARTKGSIKEEFPPPEEVLLGEEERVAILADLMFELIAEQLAQEDSHA